MDNKKDNQVIYIKDLLFAALYQWRRILITALVLAVILGAVGTFSEYKRVATVPSEEALQKSWDVYNEQKSNLEERVVQAQAQIESQEEYNAKSPVMSLNPYGVYKAFIELTVQTDYEILPGMVYQNPDNTNAILHSYVVHLTGDQVLQSIADALGLKVKYLAELIYLENGGSSTRSLSITVTYYSAEGAEQILDTLKECMQTVEPQIDQAVGEHSISIVTEGVSERIDLSVTTKQTAAVNRLDNLHTALTDLKTQLNALQPPEAEASISVKKIVIFAVLGAVLGAGIICCAAWFSHIANGKIYSARTLWNYTGLKVLGCIPDSSKKCASWLRKLEGRCVSGDSSAVVAANVRNYCKDTASLLVICDCDEEASSTVTSLLQNTGMHFTACGSLLTDTAALDALPTCDAVLLIEMCGSSRYTNVLQMSKLIADQGKQLVGCVLVGG